MNEEVTKYACMRWQAYIENVTTWKVTDWIPLDTLQGFSITETENRWIDPETGEIMHNPGIVLTYVGHEKDYDMVRRVIAHILREAGESTALVTCDRVLAAAVHSYGGVMPAFD